MLAIHNICRNVIKYVFSLGYYDFYRHHEDVTLNNNNNDNNNNNNNNNNKKGVFIVTKTRATSKSESLQARAYK